MKMTVSTEKMTMRRIGQIFTEIETGMKYVVREIKTIDDKCTVVLFRDMENGHHSYVYVTEEHYASDFELVK